MDHEFAFDDLPASVRAALVGAAADVIGRTDGAALPGPVRQLARFTPNRRAQRGAAPIGRALASDPSFRALVAAGLRRDFGGADSDGAERAARHYLLRLPGLPSVLQEVEEHDELVLLRRRVAELTATAEMLTVQLARRKTEAEPDPVLADTAERARLTERAAALQTRLREQGARHRAELEEARAACVQAAADRDAAKRVAADAQARLEAMRGRLDAETRRARSAETTAERMRSESADLRAEGDRRLGLLLDTIEESARGLRRELQLVPGGALPADVAVDRVAGTDPRPARPMDVSLLEQWMQLPHAHLVIDGYNVTKAGYPALTLAEQRDRLVRLLGGLAARTRIEVTVVFDGAAVVVPTPSTRQVRVVFSPPGVSADDVIRQLVAAEPSGRAVIVVTSDREIVDSVRRRGARTVPSGVLVQALERV